MELAYAITFFIFGLCFGSFCNVLIARLPLGQSINFPPSRCPKCLHRLKFYYNIPLVSWVFLRGKCAFCGQKISPIYPFVELLGGVLAVFALYYGEFKLPNSAFLALSLMLLASLSLIDFKYHAVPEIPLILAYFFALFSTYDGNLRAFFAPNSALISSLIFAGAIVLLKSVVSAWINRKNQGETLEAMGDADTIVIAVVGALFGGAAGIACVLIAGILQLIFHLISRDKEAPFIPALFVAILITLIFQTEIIRLIDLYLEFAGVK